MDASRHDSIVTVIETLVLGCITVTLWADLGSGAPGGTAGPWGMAVASWFPSTQTSLEFYTKGGWPMVEKELSRTAEGRVGLWNDPMSEP